MSDAFLTLAYTDGGLSCFLVPRWMPDGERNSLFIQRLKEKLGNRSNASTEIELQDTWGVMVGEEGRGVRTIIDMVQGNRFYCCFSSAALMRQLCLPRPCRSVSGKHWIAPASDHNCTCRLVALTASATACAMSGLSCSASSRCGDIDAH